MKLNLMGYFKNRCWILSNINLNLNLSIRVFTFFCYTFTECYDEDNRFEADDLWARFGFLKYFESPAFRLWGLLSSDLYSLRLGIFLAQDCSDSRWIKKLVSEAMQIDSLQLCMISSPFFETTPQNFPSKCGMRTRRLAAFVIYDTGLSEPRSWCQSRCKSALCYCAYFRGFDVLKEIQLWDSRSTTNSSASDAVDLQNTFQDTRHVLWCHFEVNVYYYYKDVWLQPCFIFFLEHMYKYTLLYCDHFADWYCAIN